MSRIEKLTGLAKARAVKHTNYIRRQLERLESKYIAPKDEPGRRITKKEVYNRVKTAAAEEGLSFKEALRQIEATRSFTSEEDNFKIQINRRLSIGDRSSIRAAIASKTGRKYQEVTLEFALWEYDSTLHMIKDPTGSVAIWLQYHQIGESSDTEFVQWRSL